MAQILSYLNTTLPIMWNQKEINIKDIIVHPDVPVNKHDVKTLEIQGGQSLDWLIRDLQSAEEKQKWEKLRNNLYLG